MRILSAMALGVEDAWTSLPLVDMEPRRFPPEPLLSVGAAITQGAIVRKDDVEKAGRRPDGLANVARPAARVRGGPIAAVVRCNVRYTPAVTMDTTARRWTILTYRVPQEPSRHRVAIWRELRKAGAVPLQQGTWALPDHAATRAAIERTLGLVERAEGEAFVFDAGAREDATLARLEAAFLAAREEEWGEFLRECDKFEAEIDREVAQGKFTHAELDEEEQNLERLQRWYRELRGRDVLGAPSAGDAEARLAACAQRLDGFAQQVFETGGLA